ncbi:MAG: hypothetical protein JSS20_16810, partial [Proteobacteria bacterium]|nr:hypothetical protein [Pseudomonadota bacterium]
MKIFSIALLTLGLTAVAAPAFAHDRDDVRRIRQDKAELRASEAQLHREIHELKDAVTRSEAARRTGHP